MKKKSFLWFLSLVIFLFNIALAGLSKAHAHCDTLEGPVVKDAKMALEKGDVTPVLKWVKKDIEPEVRAAFQTALTERVKSKEAQEKADMSFFETLVRVHRAGEGASFTGLKPAGAVEPIVVEADNALEIGSADTLVAEMSNRLTGEVKERFERVLEKKKHVNESVDAGREYVEAYIEYMHYVERVDKAAAGETGHHREEYEAGGQESRDAK